jgi:hypothetical protein
MRLTKLHYSLVVKEAVLLRARLKTIDLFGPTVVEIFMALLTFMWINSPFHRVTLSQSVHKLTSPGPG